MATPSISAPLAVRAAPSGPLSPPSLRFSAPSTAKSHPHLQPGYSCRRIGAKPRLGLRGFQSVSHGVSSQQAERIRCHSSLRQNTIVASENENPPLMPAIMTPGGALDLATVLLGNRVIFIGQYINSQVAQRVISQLVTLAAVDEEADVLIYLNCPGGSLYSILAIYDCMSWIKPKVGTVCFGVVASQAAIILAGGEKGMRYAMPNARVMIHQPQGGSEGNVEEVRRQVGETIYARDV
ncbi:ATP-dependent Clp protease proteolytic subunit 6, chloroplastic-like isoform X2 [Miscanthus floridulus]|uniref:ATP-dependent Clp protease proteolytic subunit 6, chloroplastic-like isoform X2 n=1 Tax=Miscanthus floridulus TaxID=154761 RepID=UPI003459BC25